MMGKRRSFKEFIAENFEDQIYQSVERYYNANETRINITSNRFYSITDTYLDNVSIRYVNAEDCDTNGMKIRFYPIVVATIVIEGKTRYDVDTDSQELWLRLHCSGDLSIGLRDFRVSNVEELDSQYSRQIPMTDGLVPYIKIEDMDKHATEILKAYYPEVLESPQPVTARILARRMGLEVHEHGIVEDGSVFGQIYFYDSVTELYDRNTGSVRKGKVKAKTIVVDPQASFLFSPTSLNITIAHECIHFALHRKAFELERLCNKDFSKIQCAVSGDLADRKREDEISWMEYHANLIAPRIIMPADTFKQKADEFIATRLRETGETETLEILESVINNLADFFNVTRAAAKIRMVELGYEEAVGTYLYIDGKYVKPHCTSKRGIITRRQTFSISQNDLMSVIFENSDLWEKVSIGRYVYVDTHLVLNAPKYVEKDKDGYLALTKYARYHMEECSLRFDIEAITKKDISERYFSYCVLNRDANSPYEMQIKFHNGYENSTDEKQTEYLCKTQEEEFAIFKSLPRDFKGTIENLKKWRKLTNKDIADAMLVNERTVRRILNGESGTSIENILALCFVLKLPPKMTFDVIEKSPVKLRTETEEDYKLYTLIYTTAGQSIGEVRKKAQKLGISGI